MNDEIGPVPAKPALQGASAQARPPATRTNRAIRGLAYALVVLLALLGAWAAYDRFAGDGGAPAVTQAPPPPAAQPAVAAVANPASPSEPTPAEVAKSEPAAGAAPAQEADKKGTPETDKAPAPERSWIAEGTAGKAAAAPRRRAADKSLPPVATAAAEPQPDTRATGTSGAWFVQAGVYNNLANAEAMRDKLAGNGFATLMEVRVLAGPYPDRSEAQHAQRRLGELGIAPTLLVPARKTSPSPDKR